MSNSVKKNPIIKDNGKSKKKNKQIANRTLRRKYKKEEFEIGQGNAYKKHYESWEIADYVSRWTKEDAIHQYYDNKWGNVDYTKYPTLESWLSYWEKCVVRK